MNRRIAAGLVTLATLGTAAVLWSAAADAQSSAGTTHDRAKGSTLSFDVQFSPFFLIDFGATGVRSVTDIRQAQPSKGDVTVFQDRLLRSGKKVGRDGGTCTIIALDPTAPPSSRLQLTCNVTFEIPGGTITTQGLASNAPVKHLIITGGTGRYLDVDGEATLTEFGNDTGTVVFHLAR